MHFPQNLVDVVTLLTIYLYIYVSLILIINKQNAPNNIYLASRVHTRRRFHNSCKHVDYIDLCLVKNSFSMTIHIYIYIYQCKMMCGTV